MQQEAKLQLFSFRDQNLTVLVFDDEPWFIGREVASALGFTNPSDTLKHVPDKWKTTHRLTTSGGDQNMTIISEAGVYRLVMRSKRAEAEEFQDWVCGELIPSIRKTGRYELKETLTQDHDTSHHETKMKLYNTEQELVKMHKYVARCNRNHIPGNSIYILSHNAFGPTLYKIGRTKDFNSRMSTYGTGVPPGYEYTVVYHRLALDMKQVELLLQGLLQDERLNRNKEWFEIEDINALITRIDKLCDCIEEVKQSYALPKTTKVSEVPSANPPTAKRSIKNSEKLPMKPCNTCGVTKSLEDFHIAVEHIDGRENICKPCRSKRQSQILEEKRKDYVEITEKECNKCHETFPLDDFYHDKSLVDGHMNKCKTCHNDTQRKAQKATVATEKKCTACKNTKPIDEFYKASKSPDGHSIYCKPCMADKDKMQANRRNERKREKRKSVRKERELASNVKDEDKQEVEEQEVEEQEEQKEQEVDEQEVTTKRCSSCAHTFPHTEYYKNKASKDGYVSSCKFCCKERAKKGPKKKIEIKEKKCAKCSETKPVDEFTILNQRKDGRASYCKSCANTYHNTDEAKEKAKKRGKESKKRQKEVKDAQTQLIAEVVQSLEINSEPHF